MPRRQTAIPRQWLVIDPRLGAECEPALRRLPRGSGVLLRCTLSRSDRLHLLFYARSRSLLLLEEGAGTASRVHDATEIRQARLGGTRLLLLSPLFATRSHPGEPPLARMRAAALARLCDRRAIALGGMDGRRYANVKALGFIGWAGIDAWTVRGKRQNLKAVPM